MTRERREFHWRIAVGGIRGKSSVTRLIAGALKEAGIRVIARTTGSRPVIIYPDGHEAEISRPAAANILEGKRFLHLARKKKAEVIVVELMAIKPECLEAELRKIFKPHCLVLTNFRPDHVEELGRSREEVARNMLRAFRRDLKGTTVFLLEEEISSGMKEELERNGARVVPVARDKGSDPNSGQKGPAEFRNSEKKDLSEKQILLESEKNLLEKDNLGESSLRKLRLTYGDDFAANIRLALAVTRSLGLRDQAAISGMKKARPDFGSLKIWEYTAPGKASGYVVSAFAANDPESSSLVIEKLKAFSLWEGKKIYGLLLFRWDRGDRTEQWLKAIESGFLADFDGLFLSGCPYFPFIRLLRRITKNKNDGPKRTFLKQKKDEPQETMVREYGSKKMELKEIGVREKKSGGAEVKRSEAREHDSGETANQKIEVQKARVRGDRAEAHLGSSFPPNIKRVNPEQARRLIESLGQTETTPWILIGLGNIVGLGSELVGLWDRVGRRIHG